jgi:ribose 1,5-bisphosphate isomerase
MNIYQKIKLLRIQGAENITLASLRYLKRQQAKGENWRKVARKLEKLRSTEVMLHNCLEQICLGINIEKMIEEVEQSNKKIVDVAKKKLQKRRVIMTHCHSSTAVDVIKAIKPRRIYVTETRPKMQGLKTAKELKKDIFIVDSAMGYYMPEVDYVIVGADSVRKEGIVNKIGTLPMAVTAKAFGKKVYVAASILKIDKRKRFRIEMRSPREVGKIRAANPAFDITPWKFIDGVITERGVMRRFK